MSQPDVPDHVDERAPLETGDGGPVDLSDRTAPGNPGTGYTGSPVGNQGRAEPTMPPTPGHPDPGAPLEPPSLQEMNVGTTDPQRPSLAGGLADAAGTTPHGGPTDLGGPGVVPGDDRPAPDTTSSTGRATGPEAPVSSTAGTSHRAPGLQGTTSPAEQVETDVDASAGHMVRDSGRPSGSGNPHGVESVGEVPSTGTSEEHGVVQGARIPRADGAGQD
jgi:hypothetical protein